MISKVVPRRPENDNYRALARYIADTRNDGEKVLLSWCEGCLAGDDYDLGIIEVEATQDLNTRSRKEKTYHMVVSFRPEDESVLGPEDFKAIEKEFATALGYSEHQRHCGVHKNTNNIHMHIAYNRIHPEKLSSHDPFRDYYKRDKVCRELEKRLGLSIDVEEPAKDLEGLEGMSHDETSTPNVESEKKRTPKRKNSKAADYEAHSGQQSFDSWLKEQKPELMAILRKSQGWPELHRGLAEFGILIKPRGAGFVIADLSGRGKKQIHAKASAVDRAFSKKQLEDKFGPYVKAETKNLPKPKKQYDASPVHMGAERGKLYDEYKKAVETRKAGYDKLQKKKMEELVKLRQFWRAEQKRLKATSNWRSRKKLLSLSKMHQLRQEEEIGRKYSEKRKQVRLETACDSWSAFLRGKAETGNETALAILRSKNEEIKPSKRERVHKDIFRDFTYTVDLRGNVLYTLHDGSMVKDNGKEVFFSKSSRMAEEAARQLSMRKFGKNITIEGNKVCRAGGLSKER